MSPDDALRIAAEAYEGSTSFIDTNYRKQWEEGLRLFQGRHPVDSKYNSDKYKHRSRLFRPKTRSGIRKLEAMAAMSFFSNIDVVSTDAMNPADQMQEASAAIVKELLNYRLQKSIPWFLTLIGALQDAATVGVCCSYQYWKHRREDTPGEMTPVLDEMGQMVIDQMTGAPQFQETRGVKVLEDRPCVDLLPIENIRFDPASDWRNPVQSSPYVIRMCPMYVADVRDMMEQGKWTTYGDGEIEAARHDTDSTRQTRDGNREDALEGATTLKEFDTVWCHENFVRWRGQEWVYWTLGTKQLLTDPRPLEEEYFHGERPIVVGVCVIETHKVMPPGLSNLGSTLQAEANEIVNQRLDNVKLVLNKRWLVKRGQNVDTESLIRNVPGGVTLTNDPAGDVQEVNWPDVTASAFQEQDRINVDYDELVGAFSQGSVMTNRKMGETVGGMNMISQSSNTMTEYTIRTFTETWVEPVLRQLAKLEQHYESDEVVLALAGERAQLFQRFGIDTVTDELLMQDLTLTVNVGMGATDPNQKLQRFMGALNGYGSIAALGRMEIDLQEVGKEIFGLAGYKDGRRFLNEEIDPRALQLAQQQMQEQMAQMQAQGPQTDPAAMEMEAQRLQLEQQKAQADVATREAEANLNAQVQVEVARIEAEAQVQVAAIEQEAAQTFAAIQQQIAQLGQQVAQVLQAMQEKESEPEEPEEPEGPEEPEAPPMPPQATIVFEAGAIVVDAKSPAVTKTVTGRDSAGNRIELTMTPKGGD